MSQTLNNQTPVLPYSKPPPRSLQVMSVWGGIVCFYGIMITFGHGLPLFETAMAPFNPVALAYNDFGDNPLLWFLMHLLGCMKGIVLILVAITLVTRRSRAMTLAVAYLVLEGVFIAVNVYFTFAQHFEGKLKAWSLSVFVRVFLAELVELVSPLCLTAAMIILLLHLRKSERLPDA